jgi:hypothetical protein
MRRILTVLGVAALMAVMFAPVVLAVDKQCSRLPCFGTDVRDTLYERDGEGVPTR